MNIRQITPLKTGVYNRVLTRGNANDWKKKHFLKMFNILSHQGNTT